MEVSPGQYKYIIGEAKRSIHDKNLTDANVITKLGTYRQKAAMPGILNGDEIEIRATTPKKINELDALDLVPGQKISGSDYGMKVVTRTNGNNQSFHLKDPQ